MYIEFEEGTYLFNVDNICVVRKFYSTMSEQVRPWKLQIKLVGDKGYTFDYETENERDEVYNKIKALMEDKNKLCH